MSLAAPKSSTSHTEDYYSTKHILYNSKANQMLVVMYYDIFQGFDQLLSDYRFDPNFFPPIFQVNP